MNKIIYALGFLVLIAACSSEPGGLKYVKSQNGGADYALVTQKDGPKSKIGDYIYFNMEYQTMDDSVIFTTYKREKPLELQFRETLFKGLLNDGLQAMGPGDSAIFKVPVDSLYGQNKNLPGYLKRGDYLKYIVSVERIQNADEYREAKKLAREAQLKTDETAILDYIAKNKLDTKTTKTGVHFFASKEGTAEVPDTAKAITASYVGKLLNGTEFETTNGDMKKLDLTRQVPGLREGIRQLKQNGKGTIIIPSNQAYGEAQRGKIPSNSVLIYEIELGKVE